MYIQRRQIASLFLCNLGLYTVGNGLVPLLPIYARQLGADSAIAGYYLAVVYIAMALGAFSAGWVSENLHHHKIPLIITPLLCIPTYWLMGQVTNVWELTALTAFTWFTGGLAITLLGILAGLSAGEDERGKIFGFLALASVLGSFLGNFVIGGLVQHWGFTATFHDLAIFTAFFPLGALLLEEKDIKQTKLENARTRKSPGLGKSFYLLFTASLMASTTFFFVVLIRSLQMNQLKFSPFEISSTGAIASLVGIPFPLLMGWLSDRSGRKVYLFWGYLSSFASIVLLGFASALWHFWAVLALSGLASGSNSIGNALVTDLVPRESIGKGLAIFGSGNLLGGVIGFALAGYTMKSLGFVSTITVGACLAITAFVLLIPVQDRPRKIRQPGAIVTR